MENPGKQIVRAIQFLILGVLIGVIPGRIRIEQMRQEAESRETFHLRAIADLKRQMHDEENYYMQQMHIFRSAAGIRMTPPTETDRSIGTTCAEEFFTVPGQIVGSGVRSWRPRADGRCYQEDAIP
jgi:hypothetical protein